MYHCDYCNSTLLNLTNYKRHLLTKKHKNNIEKSNLQNNNNINPIQPITTLENPIINSDDNNNTNNYKNCEYCKKKILKKHIRRHYINSCVKISDKMKNKYIILFNKNGNTKHKLNLVNNKPSTIVNNKPSSIVNINTVNNTINNPLNEQQIQSNINNNNKELIDKLLLDMNISTIITYLINKEINKT